MSIELPSFSQKLRMLCLERSNLVEEDILVLENLQSSLQYLADLAGADVFIDVLAKGPETAVVVAEAKPTMAQSLYRGSVVGQYAFRDNEPAVFQAFVSGKLTPDVQGISQEGVPIIQKVTPIKNSHGQVIAVLIMERDNSFQVYQQKTVEFLSQTTQKLTDTLLNLANVEEVLPTLIHDALFIINAEGEISYANRVAHDLLREYAKDINLMGMTVERFVNQVPLLSQLFKEDMDAAEIRLPNRTLLGRTLSISATGELRGKVYLFRDITELRKKDRQLMAKSAVIKEIHHRVKNNLQTIASLMRLQMRRVRSDETRVAFQESINRIRCIALVHEMFSRESPEVVGLRDCIRRIGQILMENMLLPGQEIAVEVNGEEIFIHSDQATPTAIIVNEIMQNSIKYAFPENSAGKISVFIENHTSKVKIVIRDNGRGFPPEFDQETSANLGLQITRALVTETLEGNIVMYNDNGAVVEVEFPK